MTQNNSSRKLIFIYVAKYTNNTWLGPPDPNHDMEKFPFEQIT